ncbi:MAG: flavohemoglobin expression-modulating QEGLA motif protein [Gammaproteobacteria bacterium]
MLASPSLTPQQQIMRELSDRLVKAQRPIHILDALKWGPEIQQGFFASGFKEPPKVNVDFYNRIPLAFNPEEKVAEFYALERDIRTQLGQLSGAGKIMQRMCREYREVIRLLQARGTAEFPRISQELYGSSEDAFYAGAPTLNDLALAVSQTLSNLEEQVITDADVKCYTSEEAVEILNQRLAGYFENSQGEPQVRVKISDGIIADASAGAEIIKIRKGAQFSERDLKVIEVHEGWVHIATTINGLSQPICTFLSKGPPSSTQTQEGLATIMEIFTLASYPGRVQRITNRITAINMAEQGANFIEVFNFFLNGGLDEESSYHSAARVFRGCPLDKGAFTKDLAYTKGFVLIYNYIRLAIQRGLLSGIPLLFLGKTTLEDMPLLINLLEEGIVIAPKYIPPQFRDLAALSAWVSYSLFLSRLDIQRLAMDYKQIFGD